MQVRGLIAAGTLFVLALAHSATAATYAVVIGIDDYAHFSDLEGARNDAHDIAEVIRARGGDVVLITDEDATRSNIVSAFRAQAAKAQAGDVILLTYAGHGVQMPESMVGDEIDGMDEAFVLHGFSTSGPGLAERLRDNDLASLFLEVPDGVSVLFVADSCHSGTMTRLPFGGGELGKTRFLELGPIGDDPLPAPDARSFQIEQDDLPHVVFAAAARDNEQTPEVLIDGQRRGALSWSIARALDGTAGGGEGLDSLVDLREFVRASVRGFSGARQTPDVEFKDGAPETESLSALLSGDARDTEVEKPVTDKPASADLELGSKPTLFVKGTAPGPTEALGKLAELVEDEEEATLVWDVEQGQLVDRLSADLIAETKVVEDVGASVLAWRAVAGLVRWSPSRAFEMRLREGDARHHVGESVTILVSAPAAGPPKGHLTLVNIASGGEIQYVYPSQKSVELGKDVISRGTDPRGFGPSKVIAPVGRDTLVGIITQEPPVELRERLRELNGKPLPEEMLDLLQAHAGEQPLSRFALLPVHSARK